MKDKMLGGNISPKCEYCEFSTPTNDAIRCSAPKRALCQKIGAVKNTSMIFLNVNRNYTRQRPNFQKAILRFNINSRPRDKSSLGRLFFDKKSEYILKRLKKRIKVIYYYNQNFIQKEQL